MCKPLHTGTPSPSSLAPRPSSHHWQSFISCRLNAGTVEPLHRASLHHCIQVQVQLVRADDIVLSQLLVLLIPNPGHEHEAALKRQALQGLLHALPNSKI